MMKKFGEPDASEINSSNLFKEKAFNSEETNWRSPYNRSPRKCSEDCTKHTGNIVCKCYEVKQKHFKYPEKVHKRPEVGQASKDEKDLLMNNDAYDDDEFSKVPVHSQELNNYSNPWLETLIGKSNNSILNNNCEDVSFSPKEKFITPRVPPRSADFLHSELPLNANKELVSEMFSILQNLPKCQTKSPINYWQQNSKQNQYQSFPSPGRLLNYGNTSDFDMHNTSSSTDTSVELKPLLDVNSQQEPSLKRYTSSNMQPTSRETIVKSIRCNSLSPDHVVNYTSTFFPRINSNSETEPFPSTYAVTNGVFKNRCPCEYVRKNNLYPNSMYKKHLSNSYDDLLVVGPPYCICNKYSRKSEKSLFSAFPMRGFDNHKKRWSILVPPAYNLTKFFSKDIEEQIIDTHCHLDFLFQRENHNKTFSAYKDKNEAAFPPCYGGCVTNFCNPEIYPKKDLWENLLKEESVWGAFGVHPNHARQYDQDVHDMLSDIIKHPKVVAVGEIGLDYSKRNLNKEIQKEIFKVQLKMALGHKKPIIIHCRDAKDDCLEILKKMVPRDTFIHRHCFTGDWTEAQQWLDFFPNLFIGLTALVTFKDASSVHEVAEKIPLNRLLFETDAPFFVPEQEKFTSPNKDQYGKRLSHPGMAIHVAAQIAAMKEIEDISSFLSTVRENTRRMYNI